MFEKQLVEAEILDELNDSIKKGLPEWTVILERYDDDSIEDMDDVWGF